MWEPINIFYMMYVLNVGMPDARLNTVESQEQKIIKQTMASHVTLRPGI